MRRFPGARSRGSAGLISARDVGVSLAMDEIIEMLVSPPDVALAPSGAGALGETKVQHLDAARLIAAADHDVGRLQVAVGDPFLMRRHDRVHDGIAIFSN